MAEIFPDEGLDLILNNTFGTATSMGATYYVGLFSSQTVSTVPARTATGGATPSGWQEVWAVTGTYSRQPITTAGWGAISENGNGRRRSGTQVTFTGFTNSGSAANGFFISTGSAKLAGDTILMFANFDSGVARTLATVSDQLLVTPTVQLDG